MFGEGLMRELANFHFSANGHLAAQVPVSYCSVVDAQPDKRVISFTFALKQTNAVESEQKTCNRFFVWYFGAGKGPVAVHRLAVDRIRRAGRLRILTLL